MDDSCGAGEDILPKASVGLSVVDKAGLLSLGFEGDKMRCTCNAFSPSMKTASFPSLRVDPRLRDAAQSVLQEGETLSGFIETSVRESIERRRARAEFIARGLASREQAQSSGVYIAADEVRSELDKMLSQRQADLRVKAQR